MHSDFYRVHAKGLSASPTAGGSRGCLWTSTRLGEPTRTSGGRGSRSRCAKKLNFWQVVKLGDAAFKSKVPLQALGRWRGRCRDFTAH